MIVRLMRTPNENWVFYCIIPLTREGTGKTITLKVVAEQLSNSGVPVFLSDVKGDLCSLLTEGTGNEKIQERVNFIGIDDFEFESFPVEFLDIFGEEGTTVRASVSQMGPVMFSKLLSLNDVQSGVMNIAFKVADDNGLLLEDLKDLRAVLNFISENATVLTNDYGNISKQSVGAILRNLLILEQQGGNFFFGEPSFNVADFLRQDKDGRGIVNILNSKKLMQSPQLYSTFLFWLLSELYENLPEVGDLDRPKIVFFFDEAHLLFKNDSDVLLEKIELIVRLIRSKGVGVFFITQNPTDIPDSVSSQLGTRVQHGLRAFSPKELKSIKYIAETLRSDGSIDVEEEIKNLGVGEAIVSTLDEKGIPTFARKIMVAPPRSQMGVANISDIQFAINNSQLNQKYAVAVDNFSAYEAIMQQKSQAQESQDNEATQRGRSSSDEEGQSGSSGGIFGALLSSVSGSSRGSSRRTDSGLDRFTKNMMSTVGRELGREITRGIFGTRRR